MSSNTPSRLQEMAELQQAAIAGEIHDSLLPYLFASRMRLEALLSKLQAPPSSHSATLSTEIVADEIKQSIGTIQQAMQIGRQLLSDLYPPDITQHSWRNTLTSAFVALVANTDKKLVVEGDFDQWVHDPDCRITARRIAQESIRNAIRHGDATTITVSTKPLNDRKVELLIVDNGQGFEATTCTRGFGLRIMQSRAKLIDAGFHIRSELGGPTCVTLIVDRYDATGSV
jgi:signal transduction histidine kinase